MPGVAATGFAPGASRPVLRGFGGERVRVLTDGVGALDASGASADHAVAVDPLIADRIEVLRGPAVLLYGSSAIGGAVNIITKRIPPRLPEEPIHIDALAGIDSASDLREGGLSLDAPLAAASPSTSTAPIATPTISRSPALPRRPRCVQTCWPMPQRKRKKAIRRKPPNCARAPIPAMSLPNSFTEATSLGTGLAYFSGDSNIGVSFDYYDTSYGVPGLPGVGHVHGEEEGGEEAGEEEGGRSRLHRPEALPRRPSRPARPWGRLFRQCANPLGLVRLYPYRI